MEYTKGENEDADCRPDRESDKDDKGFTKGEWKVSMGGSHVVVMKDGGIFDVAYCDDKDMPIKERNANAERIVKAVNCHDELVEALKGIMEALESYGSEHNDVRVAYNLAKPFLAKAGVL